MKLPGLIPGGIANFEDIGLTEASTSAVTVTGGGGDIEGSWAELIASTAFDADIIGILPHLPSSSNGGKLDIGIGAASSEVIIIPNIDIQFATSRDTDNLHMIPVQIPAGSRVAARFCSASTNSIAIGGFLIESNELSGGRHIALSAGANCYTPITVDPGATINTKGSWAELDSSTEDDINYNGTARRWFLDIGVGAASSERVIMSNLIFSTQAWAAFPNPITMRLPCNIPAGTRVAARCQCTDNTDVERYLNLHITGEQF